MEYGYEALPVTIEVHNEAQMPETDSKKIRIRFPGPSRWAQDFILCILLHLLLPLLPLGLELWITGRLGAKSVSLAAAMYSVSIGISSRSRALFGFAIAISLLYSMAYGFLVGGASGLRYVEWVTGVGLALIFITHLLERYNRHVVERTPFLEFVKNGSE
jgi:hypothetical protein